MQITWSGGRRDRVTACSGYPMLIGPFLNTSLLTKSSALDVFLVESNKTSPQTSQRSSLMKMTLFK